MQLTGGLRPVKENYFIPLAVLGQKEDNGDIHARLQR